jgi:hypothetical protein
MAGEGPRLGFFLVKKKCGNFELGKGVRLRLRNGSFVTYVKTQVRITIK